MVEEENANAGYGKSQDIKRVGADEHAGAEGSGNKRCEHDDQEHEALSHEARP